VTGGGPERLLVYRRAGAFADGLQATVTHWPRLDQWTVGVQLIRSADSVAANIAESTGRWTPKDQMRFLITARGSIHEVQHWLIRASARDLALPADARREADEIARMLNGLIKSTSRRISR
jgi:four helix bundle protein